MDFKIEADTWLIRTMACTAGYCGGYEAALACRSRPSTWKYRDGYGLLDCKAAEHDSLNCVLHSCVFALLRFRNCEAASQL